MGCTVWGHPTSQALRAVTLSELLPGMPLFGNACQKDFAFDNTSFPNSSCSLLRTLRKVPKLVLGYITIICLLPWFVPFSNRKLSFQFLSYWHSVLNTRQKKKNVHLSKATRLSSLLQIWQRNRSKKNITIKCHSQLCLMTRFLFNRSHTSGTGMTKLTRGTETDDCQLTPTLFFSWIKLQNVNAASTITSAFWSFANFIPLFCLLISSHIYICMA